MPGSKTKSKSAKRRSEGLVDGAIIRALGLLGLPMGHPFLGPVISLLGVWLVRATGGWLMRTQGRKLEQRVWQQIQAKYRARKPAAARPVRTARLARPGQPSRFHPWLDGIPLFLALLYLLDRGWKWLCVQRFFRQPAPPPPPAWPSVTLLQPVTRGPNDLPSALAHRLQLSYPGRVQHLLICDAADLETQAICRLQIEALPEGAGRLVLAGSPDGLPASKIAKLTAGLPLADGQVLAFIDDDVSPRPDALQILVTHLNRHDAGAAFGVAYYTNWRTRWSSLMSGFVNANALLSYIPLTCLVEPFTITGHFFALRRTVFDAAGGLNFMGNRIDDDHELARRVRRLGLRCVQTPLVYDVDNALATRQEYSQQMKRWFVLPRQTMLPGMTGREQAAALLGSAANLIPGLLALWALFTRRRAARFGLWASAAAFTTGYGWGEYRYLGGRTPLRRWPLLILVVLLSPFQALRGLLADNVIEWRGQKLRILRGGRFERL